MADLPFQAPRMLAAPKFCTSYEEVTPWDLRTFKISTQDRTHANKQTTKRTHERRHEGTHEGAHQCNAFLGTSTWSVPFALAGLSSRHAPPNKARWNCVL